MAFIKAPTKSLIDTLPTSPPKEGGLWNNGGQIQQASPRKAYKTFNIYVDTFVQTIDGQFKPAGRDHAVIYKVGAADDVNALLIFRQQHPNLVVGACEEDISAEFANAAAGVQTWSFAAQDISAEFANTAAGAQAWSSAAQTWPSATMQHNQNNLDRYSKPTTQEIPKISGGTWKKMFSKTKNK
jgi:hypothetical protein